MKLFLYIILRAQMPRTTRSSEALTRELEAMVESSLEASRLSASTASAVRGEYHRLIAELSRTAELALTARRHLFGRVANISPSSPVAEWLRTKRLDADYSLKDAQGHYLLDQMYAPAVAAVDASVASVRAAEVAITRLADEVEGAHTRAAALYEAACAAAGLSPDAAPAAASELRCTWLPALENIRAALRLTREDKARTQRRREKTRCVVLAAGALSNIVWSLYDWSSACAAVAALNAKAAQLSAVYDDRVAILTDPHHYRRAKAALLELRSPSAAAIKHAQNAALAADTATATLSHIYTLAEYPFADAVFDAENAFVDALDDPDAGADHSRLQAEMYESFRLRRRAPARQQVVPDDFEPPKGEYFAPETSGGPLLGPAYIGVLDEAWPTTPALRFEGLTGYLATAFAAFGAARVPASALLSSRGLAYELPVLLDDAVRRAKVAAVMAGKSAAMVLRLADSHVWVAGRIPAIIRAAEAHVSMVASVRRVVRVALIDEYDQQKPPNEPVDASDDPRQALDDALRCAAVAIRAGHMAAVYPDEAGCMPLNGVFVATWQAELLQEVLRILLAAHSATELGEGCIVAALDANARLDEIIGSLGVEGGEAGEAGEAAPARRTTRSAARGAAGKFREALSARPVSGEDVGRICDTIADVDSATVRALELVNQCVEAADQCGLSSLLAGTIPSRLLRITDRSAEEAHVVAQDAHTHLQAGHLLAGTSATMLDLLTAKFARFARGPDQEPAAASCLLPGVVALISLKPPNYISGLSRMAAVLCEAREFAIRAAAQAARARARAGLFLEARLEVRLEARK